MIEELYAVLERIKGTSSRIGKEEIIIEFKDNEVIKKGFNFLFNDFITTGLDVKKLKKDFNGLNTIRGFSSILDLFDHLEEFNTGTDSMIQKVQMFIRSNAKTPEMVTFLEELFTKTYRAGFTARTVNKAFGYQFIPEFNVQLAHPYDKYADKVSGTFALSVKLDGNRMLAIVDADGNAQFFTRKGKVIDGLDEISADIKEYATTSGILGRAEYNNGFVLDGEVLIKGDLDSQDAFQETMKVVRKKGTKTGLNFWVFDIIPTSEFLEGESTLTYLRRDLDLVSTFSLKNFSSLHKLDMLYIGNDKEVIPTYLEQAIAGGEEGLMLNTDVTYKCKRHNGLLKIKEFKSSDVLITGVFEGTGQLKGTLGGIIIDWKGHEVRVGSGFSFEERDALWSAKDGSTSPVGMIAEIQYFGESTNQKDDSISLRFPTFKGIRSDKTVEDISYES